MQKLHSAPRRRQAGAAASRSVPAGPISSAPQRAVIELVAILTVIGATTLEVRHLAHSHLGLTLLYNGDSLTLPLMAQSVLRGAPFHPILSSQLTAFPEGPIYVACWAVTTSVRAALVLNSYANVVLLYGGFRWIARYVLGRRPARESAAAVGCTVIFVLCTLLERAPVPGLTTPFLFTTYYYGVELGGLVAVAIALHQISAGRTTTGRIWAITALGAVVAGLTSWSDPLYLIQVAVPFLVTVGTVWLLGAISFLRLLVVAGTQVAGVLIGEVLHHLFNSVYGDPASHYVHFDEMHKALKQIGSLLKVTWHGSAGQVELIVVFGMIALALAQTIGLIARRVIAPHTAPAGPASFVVVFSFIAPVAGAGAVIVSGNALERYFLPIAVFPLMALIPLVRNIEIPRAVRPVQFGAVCATGLVLAGAIAAPQLGPLFSTSGLVGETCLTKALQGAHEDGVGSYWTSRPLELYGSADEQVLQITPHLKVHDWLVNLGVFEHKSFSFVLVDRTNSEPGISVVAEAVTILGNPDRVTVCPQFIVNQYRRGTNGYRLLNQTIDQSLAEDLRTHG